MRTRSRRDLGDVAFFEIDDLVGVTGAAPTRRTRGSSPPLARRRAAAGALARADHALRLVLGRSRRSHRRRRARRPLAARRANRSPRRTGVVDQMRDDLGVGLRGEHVALRLQARAQLLVVLDDAVVHHRDVAAARHADGRCARPARRAWPSACGRCRSCRRAWRCATCASSSATRADAAHALQLPRRCRARRRRPSRSRGIRAGAGLRSGSGTMLRCATAPTMPHMCSGSLFLFHRPLPARHGDLLARATRSAAPAAHPGSAWCRRPASRPGRRSPAPPAACRSR